MGIFSRVSEGAKAAAKKTKEFAGEAYNTTKQAVGTVVEKTKDIVGDVADVAYDTAKEVKKQAVGTFNKVADSFASVEAGGVKNPNKIDPALDKTLRKKGYVDAGGKTIIDTDSIKKINERRAKEVNVVFPGPIVNSPIDKIQEGEQIVYTPHPNEVQLSSGTQAAMNLSGATEKARELNKIDYKPDGVFRRITKTGAETFPLIPAVIKSGEEMSLYPLKEFGQEFKRNSAEQEKIIREGSQLDATPEQRRAFVEYAVNVMPMAGMEDTTRKIFSNLQKQLGRKLVAEEENAVIDYLKQSAEQGKKITDEKKAVDFLTKNFSEGEAVGKNFVEQGTNVRTDPSLKIKNNGSLVPNVEREKTVLQAVQEQKSLEPGIYKEGKGAYNSTISETPGKVKDRGFIETVNESPFVPEKTKEAIQNLPESQRKYSVYSDLEAISRAQTRIREEGVDKALSYVLNSKEINKDVSTTGLELARYYRGQGNTALETEVLSSLAQRATEAGQFNQALSMLNRLSPEGVLMYAEKRIGQPLSTELADRLKRQAEIADSLPFGYAKMRETQKLSEMIANETPRSFKDKAFDWVAEIANTPRAVMSSFDFSFGLRQGVVAGAKEPKIFGKAFAKQFKAFASEKGYGQIMDEVILHPDFQLAESAGISFSDINAKLTLREEKFMSSIAEKIPLFGRGVRASNRAYTAFANKLRMDTFSSMLNDIEKSGVAIRKNEKQLKELASLVNDMTGRGDLRGSFQKAAPLLNSIFFSPRLMASRLHLLNPVRYGMASAPIRKQYLKTMIAFGGAATGLLALASRIPGASVGTDMRSADFGKIKIGNIRFDLTGGFQQYFRIAAQLATGKYINSSTGKVITLGEGYKPMTRKEILLRALEGKEAPIMSFITGWLQGQDAEGEKFNLKKEAIDRLKPMILNDLYDLYKEDPSMAPLGLLSLFGVSVQTYGPPEAYKKLNEIENASDPAKAFEDLAEENPKLAEQVSRAKKEQSFTEFDWGLTYMGVENGDRAKFLVEYFNRLPDDESRADAWENLSEKGLISDRVSEQIMFLLNAENQTNEEE